MKPGPCPAGKPQNKTLLQQLVGPGGSWPAPHSRENLELILRLRVTGGSLLKQSYCGYPKHILLVGKHGVQPPRGQ